MIATRPYRAVLFALLLALAGCASLPTGVARAPSTAMVDVASTELARIAAAATPDDKRHLSGFRVLSAGDHAFNARIALARRAQKTLDIQYYLIASDTAGLQFLRELRDAAARGVRVRLLLDDLYTAGQDELLAALAAHDNVEVRLFNPLPARSTSLGSRVVFSLHDFGRINRRMHNKLFIADNAFAVSGGRNVANEYFMRSAEANFIDVDVLSSGPVVRTMSEVFDGYWNSEHVYALQSLIAAVPDAAFARQRFNEIVQAVPAEMPVLPRDGLGRTSVEAQLASGRLELHFATAQVIADSPSKAAGIDPSSIDGTAMRSTLSVMRSARSEVVIASPYFVPGQHGLALMQEAIDHNVRVVVMTNSLAATDEPLVHFGYSRYRREMLKMGVTLYELSPTLTRKSGALGDFRSSLGRLHAKLAIVDRRWLMVGSMNMDGRSARSNTEMGLVIDSAELVDDLMGLFRRDRFASTYRLRLAADSERSEWIAAHDDQEVVHRDEPDASWALRLKLSLLSLFVAEELL
jgi:putative cardiolipin synthase